MLTLSDLLHSTAQTHGARRALADGNETLSWRQYLERIGRTAALLRSRGLAPGERFGVLARNCVVQGQLFYGGYWAGVVPVPLNFRQAPREIAQMLEDAQCRVLFVDAAFLPLLDDVALSAWKAHTIVIALDDAPALHAGVDTFDRLLAHETTALAPHASREDDDALILFTGGTTGRSKGVRLSHRNIATNAMQLARVMSPTTADVYLHLSPMFHSTDLKATVVTAFGGSHVYLKEFSVDGVMRAVERHGVTLLSIVPSMIVRLLREADFSRYDHSSLRLISYGSSPMAAGVLRDAMALFPKVGFHQCYGLTETAPLVAVLDEASHRDALAGRPELLSAAGRVLPGVSVRFVDPQGQRVGDGEVGEILVRGPQVSSGYLNRADETAAAFRDGWFHTGDLGKLDDDGYLYVLGRRKEMVITGGENVYTREVERVLEQHPDVAEAAVIGVPDERFGEALLAVIVTVAGAADPEPDALITYCRLQLGGYKIPRRYLFVKALPRTAVGKVQKHELQSMWARVDARSEAVPE